METQKIVNLFNLLMVSLQNLQQECIYVWYVINDQSNTEYGKGNENDSSINFETKVIKSNLCDFSDAYNRRYNSYKW